MNARILKLVPISLLAGAALIFAGCHNKQAPAPEATPAGGSGGGIVSAEKNSFDEVTAKLDKGGSFYMYLSTEQALGKLSATIANISNTVSGLPSAAAGNRDNVARGFGFINDLIKDSGVEQISGIGASSIARDKGFYYSKFVVHHYEGQGDGTIWKVFGKEPHPLKELDMLPENTAFATYSDFDVPLAWKTLVEELKHLRIPDVDRQLGQISGQFKMGTGLDLDELLASFGGGYGVILTVDETKKVSLPIPNAPMEIAEPGLAIFVKVKSDLLFNRVDQLLSANPMIANLVLKSDTGDVKSRTVMIPLPLPIELKPTLARSGDYLFLTSTEKLLQDILQVQSGKKLGFKSTDEFKKLAQGVPLSGNNFSLISEKLGRTLNQAMQGVLASQGAALGGQAAALKAMMATNANLVAFSVGVNGPQGWEAVANGNKSMNAMFIPAVIGAVAMGAAVALPAIAKARNASQDAPQYSRIIENLRQIDTAKAQCALEKNKANGAPVSLDELSSYLTTPISPVAGEFYIPNPVGIPPKARLAQAMHGHPAGAEVSAADQ